VLAPTVLPNGRRQKTDRLDARALLDRLDRYLRGNPTVRHLLVETVGRLLRWQPQYPPLQRLLAVARRLAIDLWRLATGQCSPERLPEGHLCLVGAPPPHPLTTLGTACVRAKPWATKPDP
jgi:hypothetical protein